MHPNIRTFLDYPMLGLILAERAGDEGSTRLFCHVGVKYPCLRLYRTVPKYSSSNSARAKERAVFNHRTDHTVPTLWISRADAWYEWPSVSATGKSIDVSILLQRPPC